MTWQLHSPAALMFTSNFTSCCLEFLKSMLVPFTRSQRKEALGGSRPETWQVRVILAPLGSGPSGLAETAKVRKGIKSVSEGMGRWVHPCSCGLQVSAAPLLHDLLLFLSPFITTSSILLCACLPRYSSWHWYWPEWLKWTLGNFTSMMISALLSYISIRKLLLFLVSCSSPCDVTLKSSSSWAFAPSCCFQFSRPVKPSFQFIFWEFRCHDKMTGLSTVAYFLSNSGFWKPEFRRGKEYRGRKSHGYTSPCLPLIQSEAHCTQLKKDLEKSQDIVQEG